MGSRPFHSTGVGKARSGKPSLKFSKATAARERKPNIRRGIAAVDALRETRDGVSATALREIRRKLDIASAVAYVCAATLRAQAADCDNEVALCLQRCVGDVLFEQIQHINRLLGDQDLG